MTRVSLLSDYNAPVSTLPMGSSVSVRVDFSSKARPIRPALGVVLKTTLGAPILAVNNRLIPGYRFASYLHEGAITCHLGGLPLMPGTYVLDLSLGDEDQDLDVVGEAITFEITPADIFGSGKLPTAGPIYWPATWSLQNGNGSQPVSRGPGN